MTDTPAPLEGIIVAADEPAGLVTVQGRSPLDLFTAQGVIPALLKAIRDEATRGFQPDLGTEKGRKDIASRAFKVARSKTYLDDLGKAEVARLKDLPRQVDAARKELRDGLDALRDEIREPLTEWEARRALLQNKLAVIQNTPGALFNADSVAIRSSIETLESTVPADFEEFCQEAQSVIRITLATLQEMLEMAEKREADARELARLQAEEKERQAEAERERLRQEGEERARRQAAEEAARAAEPAILPGAATPAEPPSPALREALGLPAPAPAPVQAAPLTVGQADALRRGEDPAADLEHRRAFNREALTDMLAVVSIEVSPRQNAEAILRAIVTGKVRHIAITY
jgi:hypothetical protein